MSKAWFPSAVPCFNCGRLVSNAKKAIELDYGNGTAVITDVPEYTCECGAQFAPQGVQKELEQLKSIILQKKCKGKLKICFTEWVNKGAKAIGKRS